MRELVGHCRVDSGQILLIDPCYVEGIDYDKICNITLSDSQAGETKEMGVAVATAFGDGSYPVYATFNRENRIAKVEILFAGYEEDDESY